MRNLRIPQVFTLIPFLHVWENAGKFRKKEKAKH